MLESFFTETTDSRASSIKMPDSIADWSDFLTNQLLRQNPQLSGKDIRVHYEHENTDMRTATGTLKVRDIDEQKLMDVPFVIRMGSLYPLDIFYPEDSRDPLPLTENRTREAIFRTRSIGRLAPRPVRGAMTDDGFNDTSPYTGFASTPYTGGVKTASVRERMAENLQEAIPSVLDDVSPHAPKEVYAFLEKEANTPQGRISIRHLSSYAGLRTSLQKMAMHAAHALPMERFPMDGLDRLRMAYIVKEGANKHTVYGFSERGDLTKVSGLPDEAIQSVAKGLGVSNADDMLNGVYRTGETVLVHPDHTKRPVAQDRAIEEGGASWHEAPSGKTLHVQVYRPVSMTLLQGLLVGNVMNLSGENSDHKLFVKAEAGFSYQPSMAVDVVDGAKTRGPRPELTNKAPDEGEYGTLVTMRDDVNDGELTALPPFLVKGIKQDEWRGGSSFLSMDVVFQDGTEARFHSVYGSRIVKPVLYKKPKKEKIDSNEFESNSFYEHTPLRHGSDYTERFPNYLIPSDYILISLGQPFEVASSVQDIQEKEIEKTASCTWPIRVVYSNEMFSVRTADPSLGMQKIANRWGFRPDELTASQAEAILSAAGLSKQASQKLLRSAHQLSSAYAHIAPYANEHEAYFEKQASFLKGTLSEIDRIQAFLQEQPLLKIASVMPNSSSAANILSLRLLSIDTLRVFAARAGDLKKTLSFLCTLLLTKRIEDSLEIEEEDMVSAIKSIDNVLDSLRKINGIISAKPE